MCLGFHTGAGLSFVFLLLKSPVEPSLNCLQQEAILEIFPFHTGNFSFSSLLFLTPSFRLSVGISQRKGLDPSFYCRTVSITDLIFSLLLLLLCCLLGISTWSQSICMYITLCKCVLLLLKNVTRPPLLPHLKVNISCLLK